MPPASAMKAPLLPPVTTMPVSKRVLMTYASSNSWSEAAAGAGYVNFFRLNSVYDPDYTGAGTTAGGFSIWSGTFSNYRVNRVTVRFSGTATTTSGAFVRAVAIPLPQLSSLPSNPLYWQAIPGVDVADVAPNANGGNTLFHLQRTYDLPKVLRITRSQYLDEADYTGTTSGNPTRQVFIALGFFGAGSASAASAAVLVQITYEVEWFNPLVIQL